MGVFNVWERYFLREFFKLFCLFILCFYGLYILIDFTSHTNGAHYYHTHFAFKELFLYYCCEFIRRADVLIPFALLIASVRTLCMLNVNHELLALLAGGIHLKRLLRPFLIVGITMTLLMYVNEQYLKPFANSEAKGLSYKYFLKKNKKSNIQSVESLTLDDHSKLLYHMYDEQQHRFLDAYWIRSINEIFHFKSLDPKSPIPKGYFVDKLQRSLDGNGLHVVDSYPEKEMREMRFNKKRLKETLTLPEDQSISDLWGKLPSRKGWLSDKQAQIVSVFYRKIAIPWLCLLAIIGPAPFCLRITRNLQVFYIYALSIFIFVTLHLALDAAVVLGKRQVFPPELAIIPTFLLFFLPAGVRYRLLGS